MNITAFVTFGFIVLARVTDVSLDTIRMVSVVQGRRLFAAVLGFFQAVVFICAVAKVLQNMNQPVYALAYGLGFAAGTYLGMTIEQRLANTVNQERQTALTQIYKIAHLRLKDAIDE